MSGTVYLVGAGPGAADLLTLRAARLLGEAGVVFYDALVGNDILALASRAEKVAVGKRGRRESQPSGRHSTAQVFINKRLADAAQRHRVVVRLKGGDPLLFGRAQEEIDFLRARGIPVQVVPGITAALGAGAALGTSLTRRGLSRSVVFATPRVGAGEPASDWALGVAHADTAALYMASHDAAAVRDALIAAGRPAITPVVLAVNVSLEGERFLAATLADLPRLAEQAGGAPALLLVGEVFAGAQRLARDAEPRVAAQSA
jgi:uroporphyrin-III C-methyltransferase